MTSLPRKRRVSVTIAADLVDAIDQFSDNRSAAIEEALRLWRIQKIDAQLRQYYQTQPQLDLDDEKEWAAFAQQQLEETLDHEGL